MALSTFLSCPQCGQSMQTTQDLQSGAKVRCPHCRHVFRLGPSGSDPVGDTPVGSVGPDLLSTLLADDDRSAPVGPSDRADLRYRGVTNEALAPPARYRTSRRSKDALDPIPGAAASERSKDRLIGGKGVRFVGSREFLAVVLVVALMFLGYFCFMWWIGQMHDLSKTSEKVAETKKKKYQGGVAATSQPAKARVKTTAATPSPSAAATRTAAGTPQRIGVTEVRVVSAIRRLPEAITRPGGLTITLRITNLSAQPIIYYKRSLTLRDRAPAPQTYPLLEPPVNQQLEASQTIEDVLVFGPTSMSTILDLDLPAWRSDEKFQFAIIPGSFTPTGP